MMTHRLALSQIAFGTKSPKKVGGLKNEVDAAISRVPGQPVFGPGIGTTHDWFNPAAFATPAAYTFGAVGRNTVYGADMQTMDVAMTRSFVVRERVRIELRAEAYDSLNHSNWGAPNRFVNTPQFGSITEASAPGREFRMSARLSY
jgi:hypothetical protein